MSELTTVHLLAERSGLVPIAEPVEIARGWESVIWKLPTAGGALAIRVYARKDPTIAQREAAVMRRLRAADYPVPAIHDVAVADDGTSGLVMDFIDGPALWDTDTASEETADRLAALMAALHRVPEPEAVGADPWEWMESGLERIGASERGFADVVEWLRTRVDSIGLTAAPTHLDFHDGNVVLDSVGAEWVVDWTSFRITDPRFDIHWTRLLWAMYESEEGADLFGARYAGHAERDWETERDFFETACALRRLVIVDEMLRTGQHAADDLQGHLPRMAVPLEWIRRHTGMGVPVVESWLA